jgi:hypothetical protein
MIYNTVNDTIIYYTRYFYLIENFFHTAPVTNFSQDSLVRAILDYTKEWSIIYTF